MNLYSFLADGFPADRKAVCFDIPGGKSISYGELTDGAGRAARLLQNKGVKPGDRVLLQAQKCVEAVMLYLGVLKVGGVFVPLNTAYTEAELDYFVEDAEPQLFVRNAVAFMAEAADLSPLDSIATREHADLASLVYTSGTTGKPKGAMLTHGGLADNAEVLTKLWGFTTDDTLLHALPIFHIHGLFIALHCVLRSGCKAIWLAKYEVEQIVSELGRSTVMMGVPTFYTRLLDFPGFTKENCANVRLFVSGSAPMLEATFNEFKARTGHAILERYGMSEALIITSNPLDGERKAGTVGFPVPGYDVRIVGEQPGIIQIKGPSMFTGYWRNPEKTAEEISSDGYFATGDVGQIDEEGRVTITGRAKDLIITGGYNVYPKEVEQVLDSVSGVVESAVVGVPHTDFGEAVVAVLVGSASEAELMAACRKELAGYKVPKHIEVRAELPRNAMGKVQKAELRRELADLFVK